MGRASLVQATADYFQSLVEEIGTGWNRFWYTPTAPTTLGALRIGAGLMALLYVAPFSYDLTRLFAFDGMLPTETVAAWLGSERLSLLNYTHTSTDLWALHIGSLIVLLLFTLGLFTRTTSVLSLIVVLSYINRAPMLANMFEPILAMVMFYVAIGCAFVRTDRAPFSLDQILWRQKQEKLPVTQREPDSGPYKTIASTVSVRLLQVHICIATLMMGVAKLCEPAIEEGGPWWRGEAVWWLIARPESRLVDFTGLHDYMLVLNAWSHAIVLFELLFPILIWKRALRPLLLALAVPMWISLALITGLLPFCLMMLVAYVAFVPNKFWSLFISQQLAGDQPTPAEVRIPPSFV